MSGKQLEKQDWSSEVRSGLRSPFGKSQERDTRARGTDEPRVKTDKVPRLRLEKPPRFMLTVANTVISANTPFAPQSFPSPHS